MKQIEIKFRAWQDDKMLTAANYGLGRFFGILYEDTPIMQYTGLNDMNGKEIYEGDILRDEPSEYSRKPWRLHAIVIWKGNGWKRDTYNGDMQVFPDIDCRKMEVIGNIYENPKLLKSGTSDH